MPYLLLWLSMLLGVLLVLWQVPLLSVLLTAGCMFAFFRWRKRFRYFRWLLVVLCGLVTGGISGSFVGKARVFEGDICIGHVVKQYGFSVSVKLDTCQTSDQVRGRIYASCGSLRCPDLYKSTELQIISLEQFGRFVGKGKITNFGVPYTVSLPTTSYYTVLSYGRTYRENYYNWLRGKLPVEHSAFIASMLFGETHLPRELTESMKVLGVLHVVAISGINIRYLQLLVSQFTKKLRRRLKEILDFLVLGFLFVVVGEAVSLFRAIIMCVLLVFIKKAGTPGHKWHFCIGLSLLLLMDASYIFDAGYWLVSGACVGVYILANWIESKKFVAVVQEVLISIGIWVCVAPVQWLIFKEVTPWGIVTGLVISPVIEAITIIGYLGTVGRFVPGFEVVLRAVLGILVSLIIFIINLFHVFAGK